MIENILSCDEICVQDITKFMKANGFKQSTIHGISPTSVKLKSFKRNSKHSILTAMNYEINLKQNDFLIIDSSNIDLEDIVSQIQNHKVRRTLVLTKSTKAIIDFAEKRIQNLHFYIYHKTSRDWQEILTLKSNSKVVLNQLHFDNFGRVKITQNLQGIALKSTTLPWCPYVCLDGCNELGQNCKTTGALVDLVKYWGKSLNFTLEVNKEINDGWGTEPKSGMFSIILLLMGCYLLLYSEGNNLSQGSCNIFSSLANIESLNSLSLVVLLLVLSVDIVVSGYRVLHVFWPGMKW